MNRPDPKNPTVNLGFEAKLWLATDKLRNNMDAAEYKAENVFWGLRLSARFAGGSRENRS